jgi:hypothetical protein
MPRPKHLQGDRSDWGGARPGAGRKRGPLIEEGERAQVVSFTLAPQLVEKLTKLSKETGKSRSKLVEEILQQHL